MTRVFEQHESNAAAERASVAARADVLKRFYVPIVGSLRCKFAGVQDPEAKDLIVYDTKVVFHWEFSAPHVKGSVEQALLLRAGRQDERKKQNISSALVRSVFVFFVWLSAWFSASWHICIGLGDCQGPNAWTIQAKSFAVTCVVEWYVSIADVVRTTARTQTARGFADLNKCIGRCTATA